MTAAAVWLVTPAADMAPTRPSEADRRALQQLGVSAEQIAAAHPAADAGHDDGEACVVWDFLWDAVQLFDAMRTQWRFAVGMGGVVYVGLDYGPMRSLMRPLGLLGRRDDRDLLRQFQVMERAARDEMNERAARQA